MDSKFGGIPASEDNPIENLMASKFGGIPVDDFTEKTDPNFGQTDKQTNTDESFEMPDWAADNPNLYGAYGAGKAVLEQMITPSVEAVGSFLGSLGSPLVGTGLGYSISKNFMDIAKNAYAKLGNEATKNKTLTDATVDSAKDVALVVGTGLAFRSAGTALSSLKKTVFEKLPERLYASAIKAPLSKKWVKVLPGKDLSARKLATIEGLKSKVRPSEYGLAKIENLEREVQARIGKVVDVLSSDPNNKIKVKDVISKGLKSAYEKAANTEDPIGMKKLVSTMAEKFKGHGEYLTPKNAQEIKKQLYKGVKWLGTPDEITSTAKKGIAKELMKTLERHEPSLKFLNENNAARIYLKEALEKAVAKNMNKDMVSLGTKVLVSHPRTWPLAFWDATLGHPQVKSSIAFALSKANPAKYSQFVYPEMPVGYIAPVISKGVYRYNPKVDFVKSSRSPKFNATLRPGEPPTTVRNNAEIAREREEFVRKQHLEDSFRKRDNVGSPLRKPNLTYQKSGLPPKVPTTIRTDEHVSRFKTPVPKTVGPRLNKPNTDFVKNPRPLSINELIKVSSIKNPTAKQKAIIEELKKRGKL